MREDSEKGAYKLKVFGDTAVSVVNSSKLLEETNHQGCLLYLLSPNPQPLGAFMISGNLIRENNPVRYYSNCTPSSKAQAVQLRFRTASSGYTVHVTLLWQSGIERLEVRLNMFRVAYHENPNPGKVSGRFRTPNLKASTSTSTSQIFWIWKLGI